MLWRIIPLIRSLFGIHTDYFQTRYMGEDGLEAFMKPDDVTIQRVYPVRTEKFVSPNDARGWGLSPSGKFKWVLAPIGRPIEVQTSIANDFATTLRSYRPKGASACSMHPDFLVAFRKGRTRSEVLTCFSCMQFDLAVDHRRVGLGSMPLRRSIVAVAELVPLDIRQEAALDEAFGRGCYRSLVAAKSAVARNAADRSLEEKVLDTDQLASLRAELLASLSDIDPNDFSRFNSHFSDRYDQIEIVSNPPIILKWTSFERTGRLNAGYEATVDEFARWPIGHALVRRGKSMPTRD